MLFDNLVRSPRRSSFIGLVALWAAMGSGCGDGDKEQEGDEGDGGGAGQRLDADGVAPAGETILLKMESVQGVSRNPPVATVFALAKASYITRVWTYHDSATIGNKSPTIAFQDTTSGVTYGPWPQVGYKTFNGTLGATATDPGNVLGPPDNYWMAYPSQTVPAGTYRVVDSDPATWSYTADLGNRGVTWVYGWLGGAPSGDAAIRPDAPADERGGKVDTPSVDSSTIDGDRTVDAGALDGGVAVPTNYPNTDDSSGIDLTGYTTREASPQTGISLAVPNGPTLTIAPNTLKSAVTIGMRPASTPPVTDIAGYTMLSPWYELATSRVETVPTAGTIVIDIPASPPATALAHPGLQVLAVVNGFTLPLDGTFDTTTGKFRIELLGLPAACAFALAFNPDVQSLTSDDLGTVHAPSGAPSWSTLDWWITFDGKSVKMEGAKKILAWARNAATIYSAAGLKEPFLRKVTVGNKARWTIHLTDEGSYFSENAALDHGLFGREYISVDRVDSPSTDPLGSGQSSVAHEMFHAVFRSYGIPFQKLQAGTKIRRSSSGINEGMATAVGYWIDQGSPAKPRPNQDVRPISWPFGAFDPADDNTMYTNQDFYVYLLRVGTLKNFRLQLEALSKATVPPNVGSYENLRAYVTALDAASTGFEGSFTQTWAWYAADRSYIRSADGWLWSFEPAGRGTPGAPYVIDGTLFDSSAVKNVSKNDCTATGNAMTCQVVLSGRPTLAAAIVSAQLGNLSLPSAMVGKALTGTVSATTASGSVAFSLFGEKNGSGSEAASLRSATGGTVTLEGVGTNYPTVRMIVVQSGAATQDITVRMTFAMGLSAPTYEKSYANQYLYNKELSADLTFSLSGKNSSVQETNNGNRITYLVRVPRPAAGSKETYQVKATAENLLCWSNGGSSPAKMACGQRSIDTTSFTWTSTYGAGMTDSFTVDETCGISTAGPSRAFKFKIVDPDLEKGYRIVDPLLVTLACE